MAKVTVTNTQNSKMIETPRDCNGVHIMWSVVQSNNLATPVDPSGLTLNFYGVAPKGELVPFDGNPYLASSYEIAPTSYSGDRQIKVEVAGLDASKVVIVETRGLF